MNHSRLIITGASGFLGRHLLDLLKKDYQIFALARRSQRECGAPEHANITWYQVDIGDRRHLDKVFESIMDSGGAEIVMHLAAHYDFTGEDHPEYWRTNVAGLRNVLEICQHLHLRRFFYASSVAACRFPPHGEVLDETSAPNGEHVYAITKKIGEEMLREYERTIPSTIVRFGAMFSDWCEYPPLYMFLEAWLSHAWNRRILGGRGQSAIPYLHVRDAVSFFQALLERHDILQPYEILIASTNGATTHEELFKAATLAYYGAAVKPRHMPKLLCYPGMLFRDIYGRILGNRPFERPWMARYIDEKLTVSANRTYERLGWAPKQRLDIVRRMPFLVENYKGNPGEWHRLNRAAMKEVRIRTNLKVFWLLEAHEQEIVQASIDQLKGPNAKGWSLGYRRQKTEDLLWNIRQLMRNLMNTVRTRERSLFKNYCRDLANLRYEQGFGCQEVCRALAATNDLCLGILGRDPQAEGLEQALRDNVTMTFNIGIDEVQDVFEELAGVCFLSQE
jgi:nucleoside-diphosphate-sugar epimerase